MTLHSHYISLITHIVMGGDIQKTSRWHFDVQNAIRDYFSNCEYGLNTGESASSLRRLNIFKRQPHLIHLRLNARTNNALLSCSD